MRRLMMLFTDETPTIIFMAVKDQITVSERKNKQAYKIFLLTEQISTSYNVGKIERSENSQE